MKIALFSGEIETMSFFSKQLEKAYQKMGDQVEVFDVYEKDVLEKVKHFIEPEQTIAISFDFIGLKEDVFRVDQQLIWDVYQIKCVNIMLDHPLGYHQWIEKRPVNFTMFCIDQNHVTYLNRFYKELQPVYFFPSGGTALAEDCKHLSNETGPNETGPNEISPIKNRPMDVCFTGNYIEPEMFHLFLDGRGSEYSVFFRSIIKELLDNPESTLEDVVERALIRENGSVTEEELKETIPNLQFIDLYVRFFMRGEVIKKLVDAGIKVHVFGFGWETLVCHKKENLMTGGELDSKTCLEEIAKSKISLNVMPWFRAGAHDRIFNSMLNGAVCLTDSSLYLDQVLIHSENALVFDLKTLEELPVMVKKYLEDDQKLQRIAECGFRFACEHSWEKNAILFKNRSM